MLCCPCTGQLIPVLLVLLQAEVQRLRQLQEEAEERQKQEELLRQVDQHKQVRRAQFWARMLLSMRYYPKVVSEALQVAKHM